ncbi:hypothetical protein quinque_014814 [Culex quinquefasciatus]
MTRHHRRTVSDVFNIEVQEDDYASSPTTAHQVVNFGGTSNKCSPSSSSSDFQNTSDSNCCSARSPYRRQYHKLPTMVGHGKSIKNNKRNMYNKTIRFMPSRLQKSELPYDSDQNKEHKENRKLLAALSRLMATCSRQRLPTLSR